MRRLEAPSLPVWPPAPPSRPPPLGQGQGGCRQFLRPRWHRGVGGREAAPTALRRRVIHLGPPRSVKGLLVGPRRPAPKPRARKGASVLCHHHHRVHRHHNHHHRRVRHRHHHPGAISSRGTSSSNNNSSSKSNGRPASRVAGRSRAPSECSPFHFFSLVYLLCRRVLTHPLPARASSPSAPKATPPPPPAAAIETAPPGSHALVGGPAAAAPMSRGVAAVEGVPTALTATIASMTVMPLSTLSATVEEAPTTPAPAIEVDAGGAFSSIPPPTPEETEVVFGR
jgi:hypothetical protein